MVFATVALCGIVHFSASSWAVSPESSLEDCVRIHCLLPDAVHPILNVKSGQGLNGKSLQPTMFAELTNYCAPECLIIWKRDFLRAESEAAHDCCKYSIGKSTKQLSTLLGRPLDIKTSSNFLEQLLNQESWIYQFGGNKLPLKFTIINKHCIWASIDYSEKFGPLGNERPDEVRRKLPHPILNVYVGQPLPNLKLDPKLYRKLNSPHIDAICTNLDNFKRAETQAAESFCKFAVGLSEKDAQFYFGRPKFKGAVVPGWTCCKTGRTIWLYYLGASQIPVRLFFQKNQCTAGELFDLAEDTTFVRWRLEEIATFSKGKSIEQIIAHEGIPDEVMDEASSQGSKSSIIVYRATPGLRVNLGFKNGICTEAESCMIMH